MAINPNTVNSPAGSSAGALRLEAQGLAWLLPPARAALIEAGRAIRVSIPQPVTTASVLFDTGFVPAPPAPLTPPVTEIAFTVGYGSLSAFNAAFRELTGRTPTQYRASFRP